MVKFAEIHGARNDARQLSPFANWMDDLLLRALDGDVEAAIALRERQLERRAVVIAERLGSSSSSSSSTVATPARPPRPPAKQIILSPRLSRPQAPPIDRSSPPPAASDGVIRNPYVHDQKRAMEQRLEYALSGDPVWLDNGGADELLGPNWRPLAEPPAEAPLYETLRLLDRRAQYQDKLEDDLANKNAEVDEAKSRIDSLKEQLERLRAGQPVNVAVATQGASHLRTMQ